MIRSQLLVTACRDYHAAYRPVFGLVCRESGMCPNLLDKLSLGKHALEEELRQAGRQVKILTHTDRIDHNFGSQ